MSEDVNLCVNCKHYSKLGSLHQCGRIKNLVDGTPGLFADVERMNDNSYRNVKEPCGPEGKYFVKKDVVVELKKETLFDKIFKRFIKE